MKVEMLAVAADANRVLDKGHVYELDREEAEELLKGGFAKEIEGINPVKAVANAAKQAFGRKE